MTPVHGEEVTEKEVGVYIERSAVTQRPES